MGLLVETSAGVIGAAGAELEVLGLSGSVFEVLLRLARSPGQRLRMSDLAAQSTLTNSGLTRLVDRLEASGHVVREPCETDRRGSYACLTALGSDALEAVLPAHIETVDRVFTSILDPEELAALLLILRKLRAVVRPGSDPGHLATD